MFRIDLDFNIIITYDFIRLDEVDDKFPYSIIDILCNFLETGNVQVIRSKKT